MEHLQLSVDRDSFWFNFSLLKEASSTIALPLDSICYTCNCGANLTLFPNGVSFLDRTDAKLGEHFKNEKTKLIEEHQSATGCPNSSPKVDTSCGLPDNLIFFFEETAEDNIQSFIAESEEYQPILVINTTQPVFALYKKKGSENDTYYQFVKSNFDNNLNVDNDNPEGGVETEEQNLEEIAYDDQSTCENLHNLPRMVGGGRTLTQEWKYVCQWCDSETLKNKNKGRFRELKNYRDHFRKHHSDVPFREFLAKVDRNEPKWFCNICRNKISLGNQLRHQIICKLPPIDNDDTGDNSDTNVSKSRRHRNRKYNAKISKKSSLPSEAITSSKTGKNDNSDSEEIVPAKKGILKIPSSDDE